MKTLLATTISALLASTATYANETKPSSSEEIETIVVNGARNQAYTEVTIETEKLLKIAGLDNDPISAVYSLPGVVYAGGDDGGEPAIRGSSPDDNAFYIDDMPASYIFHLFGDSIFNKNVVSDFALHPAAFGSQYGNATGGVFDVKLRDPRNQEITTTLDASLLKTGIMVEGGVTEDQAFYLSYRRSLMHLFLPEEDEHDDEGYRIFKAPVSDDYQGKYQWLIGDNHKLTFTATGASDVGGINISAASEAGRVDPDSIGDLKIESQFDSQGLSWQYYGDQQKIMHLSLGHTVEKEKESYGQGQYIEVDKDQYNLRFLYSVNWLTDHKLILGADYTHTELDYKFDAIPYYCTDHDADCESKKGDRIQDKDELTDKDIAVYFNDIWTINQNWTLEMGLRAERNDYTAQSFVHPRFSLNWYPNDQLTIKAKAGSYSRFPDVETVLRKVGNPKLDSPTANHYGLGFEYEFNSYWRSSIDFYYKDLADLPRSYNEGEVNEELRYSNDLSGSAYGAEWVVHRELKDGWYGWASISWSKSDRTDEVTKQTTEYYLDTPLLANVVANYKYNERWDFGLRFTLRSGAKYTPIVGLYDNPDHEGHYLPTYGKLNSDTLPVYHRLDIQANYKTQYWGQNAEWTFAIINALGRDNISGYYYAPDGEETLTNYKIEGEEGIGMFPSIGLKMTF